MSDKSYLSIVITVLPLWALLTSLIVCILLTFHRNLKATKVYDNCSKQTAQCIYYVELRSGDTSATYNRRRTTLTIDMFDDNQNTLARLAIPGHVIFGKKDSPVATIDDDRFLELRVTRFWLYRSSRLRNVSTIRFTHSCLEPEAKIMVYGVEIKSNEGDKSKLFFPVMNYISFYGATNKPNACFDLEPTGTISVMGGSQLEYSSITDHLDCVDKIILILQAGAIVFWMDTEDLLKESFKKTSPALEKGAIAGAAAYFLTLLVALLLRFLIKSNFSQNIGQGAWAYIYYGTCLFVTAYSTGIWIFTTITAYRNMYTDYYPYWAMSLGISIMEVSILVVVQIIIGYIIQLINPKVSEHYIMPDDYNQLEQQSKGRSASNSQQSYRNQYAAVKQPVVGSLPGYHQPWQQQQHHVNGLPVQVAGTGGYHNMNPAQMYSPQVMMSPIQGGYKTLTTTYSPNYDVHPPIPTPQQQQSYPTTAATGGALNQVNLQGIKASGPKKIGSSESTGSTYYQQLMKNKGGVKSISQYGELLRQKKIAKHAPK